MQLALQPAMQVPSSSSKRAGDMPEVDAAILRYWDLHPHAVDSIAGITQWWLHRPAQDEAVVEQALNRLVAAGLATAITLVEGSLVFRRANVVEERSPTRGNPS